MAFSDIWYICINTHTKKKSENLVMAKFSAPLDIYPAPLLMEQVWRNYSSKSEFSMKK